MQNETGIMILEASENRHYLQKCTDFELISYENHRLKVRLGTSSFKGWTQDFAYLPEQDLSDLVTVTLPQCCNQLAQASE